MLGSRWSLLPLAFLLAAACAGDDDDSHSPPIVGCYLDMTSLR